jgi:hypothetical protein
MKIENQTPQTIQQSQASSSNPYRISLDHAVHQIAQTLNTICHPYPNQNPTKETSTTVHPLEPQWRQQVTDQNKSLFKYLSHHMALENKIKYEANPFVSIKLQKQIQSVELEIRRTRLARDANLTLIRHANDNPSEA